MTSNEENSQKSRSTLTLKLKASPGQVTAATNSEKSINNKGSSVQVTIKGRRSLSSSSSDLSNSDSKLSKSEFEARFKALSTISDSENDSDKFDVLKKIKDTKSISEQKSKERSSKNPQSKDLQNNNFQEKSSQQFASSNKINEKSSISEKNNNDDEIVSSGNSRNKISITDFKPSVEVDNFDVLNKIRQSVEVSNKQKQEREKVLEEKRKIELERIEKEKENKAKSKKFLDDFENEKNQKKKSQFKENNKFNKRKLTYIVDDEESEQSSFYRKKRKSREIEVQAQKEYKKISREVNLPDLITVADLAERMTEKTGDVVKKLFTMGMVATSNQVIDADTAEIIIGEFGHIANRVSHSDVENILKEEDDNSIEKKSRAPIVTIMGHVDHGKTSLLDAIRSTKVVDSEHGGITQHIGASRIKTPSGKFITFLDTPGHEAFTEMRSRGANITDIVILVVAADDGVKEQTIEAISHAKAANVPIIVAVNKIDKPGADPRRVKNELLSYDIVSEDLGGDVMFIEVSAKQKLNLEKLEEAILLQAELLDLKSPYEGLSSGVVIESRVDPSKGVVVSLLVQKGTLDISDLIVVGTSYGRVRKMVDDNGKNTKTATPSVPVEILGLDQAPSAGEKFFEVKEEKTARDIILYRERKEREEKSLKNSVKSISDIFKQSGASKVKNLNVIVKADVHGSVEAICGSITKLNNEEVAIKIIHHATGGINESDITLATVSNAIIIGFNVRSNNAAKEIAKNKSIDIRYYSIIYNIIDDLKLLLSGMLEPVKSEEYLGQAEIRQVFKISGIGKIAGGFVIDGIIKRSAKVRLLRNNIVIHDGILKSLKRFKEDSKEVKSGFECGFSIENYDDIKESDIIECYEIVEQKRQL